MLDIKKLQTRLKELGFNPGKIDGIKGYRTKTALKAAQRWHGLVADGICGPLTIAALWPKSIPERDVDTQWPMQHEAIAFFGEPGTNQTILTLPYSMRLAWDKRKIINRFSIHEACHDSAARCFKQIANAYTPDQRRHIGLDLFGGCLNVRKVRGGTRWSMHAFGAAIDIDPARNSLHMGKNEARLAWPDAEQWWKIWEDEGWVSLGRSRNYDWMHVQASRL